MNKVQMWCIGEEETFFKSIVNSKDIEFVVSPPSNYPPCNIWTKPFTDDETRKEISYTIQYAMAFWKKEEIKIELGNSELKVYSIYGNSEIINDVKGETSLPIYNGVRTRGFVSIIPFFGKPWDIKAQLKDGVLTIKLTFKKEDKSITEIPIE